MICNITGRLQISLVTRDWCLLPYPGHPDGCPNWNKNEECPPKAPIVSDHFDLEKRHWFAIVEFDMQRQMKKMKGLQPKYSDRQARCCLYWQEGERRKLRTEVNNFIGLNPDLIYTLIPEAMGVHVFKTAAKIHIYLKRSAFPILYKIALIGFKKL